MSLNKNGLKANTNSIIIVVIIGVTIALLLYVVFFQKNVSQLFTHSKPQQTTNKQHDTLDKNLNEIVTASDPQQLAQEKKIEYTDDKVYVLIILRDESFILSYNYGVQKLRFGKFIQAYVYFSQLETLAQDKRIDSIRAIAKGALPANTKIFHPTPFLPH